MKYLTFTASLLLFSCLSFAQETIHKKKYLFGDMIEKYEVLKTNKKVKQGKAAIYKDTILLASGAYENNRRSGRWFFFSYDKKLEQIYDYSSRTLKVNAPGKMVSYNIPAKPGDTVQKPALIGGISTGIPFFMHQFFRLYRASQSNIDCDLYLLFYIDENGSLRKWEYQLKSATYNDAGNLDFSKLADDVAVFTPAIVNGAPIASTIIYKTKYFTRTTTEVTSITRVR